MSAISPPPRELPLDGEQYFTRAWDLWFRSISRYLRLSRSAVVTFNPASISANTTSAQDVTVSIAHPNDVVTVNKPSHTAGVGIVNARVKSAGTVEITFMNTTAGAVDPPEEDYVFILERR